MDLKNTNEYARANGFSELSYEKNEKEINDVLPCIWEYLEHFDLSDEAVPEDQWKALIEYLDKKAEKEYNGPPVKTTHEKNDVNQ